MSCAAIWLEERKQRRTPTRGKIFSSISADWRMRATRCGRLLGASRDYSVRFLVIRKKLHFPRGKQNFGRGNPTMHRTA